MAHSPARVASPWISRPWYDLAWIVGAPLLILAAISAARHRWSGEQITVFVIVWAIGHHLPGMMRAYGDRALFSRFKVRFIAAPLFLLFVGVTSSVLHLSSVPLAVGIWGWWHYLMQTHGFARIYDAKVGSVAPTTAWLDRAMCFVWFAAAAVLTSGGLLGYVNLYYKTGMPELPAGFFDALRSVTSVAVVVVTTLFFLNMLWMWRRGQPPNPLKLVLMASTFAFFWYALATVRNVLVSYALFELFHDVQYLAIVWVYNRRRAEKDRNAGSFTRFLFRQRLWLAALYLLLIFLYGSLNFFVKEVYAGELRHALIGVFVASTLLHYYFDGFIWKLRDSSTRQTLDIARGEAPGVAQSAVPRWARHAAIWCVLATPVAWLGYREIGRHPQQTERIAARSMRSTAGIEQGEVDIPLDLHRSIVAAFPQNAFAHDNYGHALSEQGILDQAVAEFRRALELNAYYPRVHYNLGVALLRQGNLAEATTAFESALELNPHEVKAHYNLAVALLQQGRRGKAAEHLRAALRWKSEITAEAHRSLADILLSQGRPGEAVAHYRAALEERPEFFEAHFGIGTALAAQGRSAAAIPHYRSALELADSGSTQTGSLGTATLHYNLGIALAASAELDEAVSHYRRVLELDPGHTAALNNLGIAYARQGDYREAVASFRRALSIDPADATARANLQRAEKLVGR